MNGKMKPERMAALRESQRQNSLDLIKRLRERSVEPGDIWDEMAIEAEQRYEEENAPIAKKG